MEGMDRLSVSSDALISTRKLELFIKSIQNKHCRNSTMQNYFRIWCNFNEFYLKLDRKPGSWEEQLMLFIGHIINKKRKSAMIKSYVSAIRAILFNGGIILNEDKCLLTSLAKACKICNNKVRVKLPIKKGMLNVILDKCNIIFQDQNYLRCLYRAVFASAYYGLLRVGEISAGNHPIKAVDVHIGENKNKLLYVLRSSKTHTENMKPQLVKIAEITSGKQTVRKDSLYCPFSIVQHYIEVRPSCKSCIEPFFVFSDRSPLKPAHVRRSLKTILKNFGLDFRSYGTHGFRGGRSCDLYNMGVSVETIKKLGRWKSNAIYAYLCE